MMIMNKKEELYRKFIDLSPNNGDSNEFTVDTIIEGRPHKIGISPEGHVLIFVECSDEKVTSNIKLKMFNVTFNRLCKLNNRENTEEKKYGIIKLVSNNSDIQKYFLDVMCILRIMAECMNKFGEYYYKMSLSDWNKVVKKYLKK